MEFFLTLLALYLFVALVVFPIWAIVRIRSLDGVVLHLRAHLEELKDELLSLRSHPVERPAPIVQSQPVAAMPASVPTAATLAPPSALAAEPAEPQPTLSSSAESIPAIAASVPPAPAPVPEAMPEDAIPPPLPPVIPRPVYPPPAPQPSWTDSINWEQFMGAKLFAWLGGLALFLGVAFFMKYSFDHGWIPPEVRVAMGFVFGAGLIVGGLKINRERYGITAQTLIATGVVSLYAVTFACNAIYHFAFFGVIPTFLLMALITGTAFVLAVRLRAQVVAILGLLGGFLTPMLLSTGVDNPGGLFGYLALLDLGLIAVALRAGWPYLVPLSAGCTALMMVGWAGKFLTAEKGPVAMLVTLGFSVVYLAAAEISRHRETRRRALVWSAVAMPLVGFGFALFFLDYPTLAAQAPLFLGFALLLDGLLLWLAWKEETLPKLHLVAGMITFLLLAGWTTGHLTDASLPWALAFYLVFGALHAVFPHFLQQRRPDAAPAWWSQLFPPLALILILLPIARLDSISFLLWPAILLVDLIAIGLALVSASLVAVGAVLVLTLLATGLSLFQIPASTVLEPSLLFVIGGFGVFFFAASFWLVRRLGDRLPAEATGGSNKLFGDARSQLPAFSALLPFLLLIMASLRLAVPNPAMIFGLGLLLVILTLGLARLLLIEWLPLCALAGMGALEFAWHSRHFNASDPTVPLGWYLGFYALFTAFPFFFRREFSRMTGPWTLAALSGLVHFVLIYRIVQLAMPNDFMGLIPALFALPPLFSLAAILKTVPAEEPKRLNQLAWFGAAGLFFITLIFPIQFDRQWLTIAWALEGAALLWLFHRVPHAGLRLVGTVLLVTAFVRLTFNSAVFSYHLRGDTPVLNWYLYAYGTVIAALFVGARLVAPPRERVLGINTPPLLNSLGVILAFLLLNIEIADYFTAPGATSLTFRFSGHFGRDMTYTIGWALFSLGLLIAGIWRQQKMARYAAIALLSVALLKLFFHDLAQLAQLYRIGALFGVAVIAIIASFAYQRFLPSHDKTPPPTP